MILHNLSLFLNPDEYPRLYRSEFLFRNRYLCNYLDRHVRRIRFHTEGFLQIAVQGVHVADDACPIEPENSLVPKVAFSRERYDSLKQEGRHEFFIGMLVEGFEKCAKYHSIPLEQLHQWIDEFRSGGYKNEWVHKSKLLRPHSLRAILLCSMDMNEFVLTLQLKRKDATVFEKQILTTLPDELICKHMFKDVAVVDQAVIVTDKYGEPLFVQDLQSLQ